MARKKIETIINGKIHPFVLNEKEKADVAQLIRKYPYDLLIECIDIGVAAYFRYDDNGQLLRESVAFFINKLGGIAYNKSFSPIEQEIRHINKKGKERFRNWNEQRASNMLKAYVKALSDYGWSEKRIIMDLKSDTMRLLYNSLNRDDWEGAIQHWITDVKHWGDADNVTIVQSGSVLPDQLFSELPSNVKSLCRQINASYEGNMYDCTAVMMRRLLEGLLVLSYQNAGIESEIMDNSGTRHVMLDRIINNAEQNKTLALSANTRHDMSLFKDLGNYSAHKIWYNCTQGDLKPHILKYRAIIEELMYKSGVKSI